MKRENVELSKDVNQALDKMDFDLAHDRNKEYMKDLQAIRTECKDTVDKYKQELNISRERVLELMEE
eukprot:CAMPEP_0168350870 /NCGR_PEP_ID=MMETSP0213-20121227/21446_1 /TAXON_ID=151035 /ORGANISM="Euplotes harpa, Strain FSP1.4" /LENGTH=66 /DNA_ID=CAMNT_0008361439 /DNA_START=176 /DNA_END=376 /DNA_ORIENTATION=-